MSSTLFFEKDWSDEPQIIAEFKMPIKSHIARRYYDHDGSLSGDRITLATKDDLEFLEKILSTCDAEDAADMQKVVDHFREHGMIDIHIDH